MLTLVHRVIMGANTAGIYGAQIFRADDRPRYRRGFTIAIGVLAFGLILALVRYVDDRVRRRKAKTQGLESSGSESPIEDGERKG